MALFEYFPNYIWKLSDDFDEDRQDHQHVSVEHVSANNMAYGRALISDRFTETLGGARA